MGAERTTVARPDARAGVQHAATPERAPSAMLRGLESAGTPLPAKLRSFFEPRFGFDFAGVRLHTDTAAAQSAREAGAAAYTVGRHIVFGRNHYAPDTRTGRNLLAHELAHVIQQREVASHAVHGVSEASTACEREADRASTAALAGAPVVRPSSIGHRPRLQRRSIFAQIAGLFRGDDFATDELVSYIAQLEKNGRIEDFTDSDNKARAVVRAWRAGKPQIKLTPKSKMLLVKEMQSGFTGDDDEQAILDLLNGTPNSELSEMLGPGKLQAEDLLSDFHGAEETRLLRFFDERFEGGAKEARKGSTRLKPRAEAFGKEKAEVRDAAEAAEVRRIIQDIKDKYGIDVDSDAGIAAIKKSYTNVPAAVTGGLKTRAWKLDELHALERALAHFAPILGKERAASTRAKSDQEVTTTSKVEQAIDKDTAAGVLDTTTLGEYFKDSKNFGMFKAGETSTIDFPGDVPTQLEGTTVHEIAHGLLEYAITSFVSTFKYWKSTFVADANATTRVANKSVEAPPSFYGGKSAKEDLSETAMFFFVKPARLQSGATPAPAKGTPGNPCPGRFSFMEKLVKAWKPKPKKTK
ncbi:MAG: DUF4157 domain-containing protein [Burkholderiales bacterium]